MRRIFWKILLSFWLAILITGIGTGVIVTVYQDAKVAYGIIETGHRPDGMTESAARTLEKGGKQLLMAIVKPQQDAGDNNQSAGGPPLPMIVDKNGKDLFDRSVSAKSLAEARRITEKESNTLGVEKVTLANGETYWIFMPRRPPPFPHNIIFELLDAPIFLLITVALTSLLFSNWLARSVSRPIETLRDSLKAVA